MPAYLITRGILMGPLMSFPWAEAGSGEPVDGLECWGGHGGKSFGVSGVFLQRVSRAWHGQEGLCDSLNRTPSPPAELVVWGADGRQLQEI